MFDRLVEWHSTLNAWVWGPYTMVLLMGTGLFLTVLTRGIQFRKLLHALHEVLGGGPSMSAQRGTVSPFQAVSTALASTVGVGNIAGVATAITLGGPGALFWLVISGLLGMATKFSEIVLAIAHRISDDSGTYRGGPMYVLRDLGLPWLGMTFALLTALAGLGIGNMVQANSVAASLELTFGFEPHWTGILIVVLTGAVILGGIRRIAEVTQFLVPFMCASYLVGALFILIRYADQIPRIVELVFQSAFTGHAAVGGFVGAGVLQTIRFGVARGLFSNEAGLGSAPIVHAAARTDDPVRQGFYGIFEVFVDTMLVCTATGFVILLTGEWTSGATGAALSAKAFETGLPGVWGDLIVTLGLVLFAYSTILGWSYYGETAASYLFGTRVIVPYRLMWLVFTFLGATGSLNLIWSISDTLNGLMAIPNLVALLASGAVIKRAIASFESRAAENR
jgi:alanine or glycine:cation symporter, AGCS family